MQYARLGNTGLKVSRICLGMMTYGDAAWRDWVLDEDAARARTDAAAEPAGARRREAVLGADVPLARLVVVQAIDVALRPAQPDEHVAAIAERALGVA